MNSRFRLLCLWKIAAEEYTKDDEAMSKAVAASGTKAVAAELRIRFRMHVAAGSMVQVRGWIDSHNKRLTKTQAVLTSADGSELAHAWAIIQS